MALRRSTEGTPHAKNAQVRPNWSLEAPCCPNAAACTPRRRGKTVSSTSRKKGAWRAPSLARRAICHGCAPGCTPRWVWELMEASATADGRAGGAKLLVTLHLEHQEGTVAHSLPPRRCVLARIVARRGEGRIGTHGVP